MWFRVQQASPQDAVLFLPSQYVPLDQVRVLMQLFVLSRRLDILAEILKYGSPQMGWTLTPVGESRGQCQTLGHAIQRGTA